MKKLLLLIFFIINVNGAYIDELYNLNTKQRAVLQAALDKGLENGFDYLLAAIAWKESSFGTKVTNHSDGLHGSYGVFQNLLTTVIKRENGNINSTEEREYYKNKLISDFDYASNMAMIELDAWLKYHKGNLRKAVMSYNAGFKYTNGERYMRDVYHRIKVLKKYHNEH